MRRLAAGIVTVALMGVLVWSGWRRSTEPRESDATRPEILDPITGRINVLLESAWRGDVPAYLASFGAPIRQRLEREVGERGRAAFAADLRRAARSRKSHALFASEKDGDDSARVTVESVYPDRNERQTFRLDRGPEGWLVTGVETIRGQIPKAKYGTPATSQGPEGVPDPAGGLAVETGEPAPGGEGPP